MANGWAPERRARQAELIKKLKLWEKSTGPNSAEGKVKASRNAYKGGVRPQLREIAKVLKEQEQFLDDLL